jgi:hypothetical protein
MFVQHPIWFGEIDGRQHANILTMLWLRSSP